MFMKLPIWLKIWVFLDKNRNTKYNFIDVIRQLKISSNSFYTAIEFLIKANLILVKKESRYNEIILLETSKDQKFILIQLYKAHDEDK